MNLKAEPLETVCAQRAQAWAGSLGGQGVALPEKCRLELLVRKLTAEIGPALN